MRANTKSSAAVNFVYAKDCPESAVIDALARKSNVMKETTAEQVELGVIFPCDMDAFEEP